MVETVKAKGERLVLAGFPEQNPSGGAETSAGPLKGGIT